MTISFKNEYENQEDLEESKQFFLKLTYYTAWYWQKDSHRSQNRIEARKSITSKWSIEFLTECYNNSMGGGQSFNPKELEQLEGCIKNTVHKINSKRIKDLNVKPKHIKLLQRCWSKHGSH